jgi:hypothetical protein
MASRGLPGCSLRALRFLRGLQKFKPKQEPIPVHKYVCCGNPLMFMHIERVRRGFLLG